VAILKYRAKDAGGKTVEGVIEAADEDQAIESLSAKGLIPVRFEEITEVPQEQKPVRSPAPEAASSHKERNVRSVFSGGGRIRGKDITAFGRQLSSLLRAGVPILKAIGVIREQSESVAFQKMLAQIYEEIKNGARFSDSLSKFPKYFSPLYLALVSAGESSGNLDQSLLRVTEYRQKQEEILSRVRSALIYPALMGLTGIGTIIFMITFVMPRLLGIFDRLGGELPMPTKILMAISAGARNPMAWGVLAVAGLIVVILSKNPKTGQAAAFNAFVLKTPVLGDFMLKMQVARFTRTMELLIKSGISVIEAIRTTAPVVSNSVLRRDLLESIQEISEGGSFGRSLKRSKKFPNFMVNLVSVGEESGKLDEALGEVASFYERETDEAVRILTSLLEPLMILAMGLVVGFIVVAMLLPMFEINMMVK